MDRANDPRCNFEDSRTGDELIAQQGKVPIQDPRVLMGDFWPGDEPGEEFLADLDEWRGHNRLEI